jgi:metal-responsive CopG/Arc/MetJ family transcriptional regulator
MSRSSPTRMTCTISDELLAELDEACYQSRVCRSEFVREALAIYLKNFHAQSNRLNSPNEKALAA